MKQYWKQLVGVLAITTAIVATILISHKPVEQPLPQEETITYNEQDLLLGSGDPWYNASWGYRRTITIDYTKLGTSTPLNSFPVLFNTGTTSPPSELKCTTNGGHVGKCDGTDILITEADGVTKLNHELEFYSSTTGETIIHFKTGSTALSTSTNTTYYMYYGNSGASDQQNATGVWDSDYKIVYHLKNGTTLTATDSTSNANNGTLTNTPTAGTGQIDGGATLTSAGSQRISTPSIASLQNASKAVMSAWMKRTASGNNSIIMTDDGSNVYLFGIAQGGFWGSGNIAFIAEQGGLSWGTVAQNDANWHYVTLVYDGTQSTDATRLRGYVDGVEKTLTYNNTIPATILGTNNPLLLGNAPGTGNYSDATMDEFRLTTAVTRSASWIKTEYNNQSSPSTFYSLGSEESYPTSSPNTPPLILFN